ncbi:MAG TPA: acyltransferase [Kofleriaceae bacterium]|nr:acyltransferase [Kofleriaceae bacterium]
MLDIVISIAKISPHRLPALDGLRALSIALVLLAHTAGTIGAPHLGIPHQTGFLGVRIFFVISGFLITTLLMSERRRTGRIAVGDFYLRRVFRIFPAFYVFLAVVLVLAAAQLVELHRGDALFAATYTMNYHQGRAWIVGHLWSLSVEEQFYLLWPAILVLVGTRRATWFAIAAVAAAPLLRVGIWSLVPALRPYIEESFPTVFDAIATGCVMAAVRGRLIATPGYRRLMGSRLFFLVPLAGLGASMVSRLWFDLALGQSITNVAIALTVDWCVRHPSGAVGRVLESRPMVWIGTLSYSIYLWQQLFLDRHGTSLINVFPLNVGLALAAAALSYHAVERPSLMLRVRLFGRPRRPSAVVQEAAPPPDVLEPALPARVVLAPSAATSSSMLPRMQ